MTLRFSPAQTSLLALCGLLTIAFLFELLAPLQQYTPPAPKLVARQQTPAPPAVFTPPPADTFAIVDTRSVFNPARTAVASSVSDDAIAAGDELPSNLALVGVILDGATHMALLKTAGAPQVTGVPEGASIEGWRVTSVQPDKVVLEAHGTRQELILSNNVAGKSAPPAADADDDDN